MTIHTPVSLNSWLTHLLERNHLECPNGQPLYQYQITEVEYADLKRTLRQQHINAGRGHQDKAWCAAFCLFCAEWFRREYQGSWSWQPIWTTLGYEINAGVRGFVVSKGLKDYWRRPLSQYNDDRNSYLGSVLREGGLPYRLLRTEDNQFQEMFKRILRDYSTAKLMGTSPHQLVAHHLTDLPEAFKQETTVNLVAQMAEQLVQLVDHYHLDDEDDPAQHLDEQHPNWRRLFPIPLDEKTGNTFLNALLSSASRQRKSRQSIKSPIVCTHFLRAESDIAFTASIQLANSLAIAIEPERLNTGRVELHIAEGNDSVAVVGIGYIQFDESGTKVYPRTHACEFRRRAPKQSLYLLIKQAGQVLQKIPIPESHIPIGEVPVGLIEDSGRWCICGNSSFSCKAEVLLILLPEKAALSIQDGEINEQETQGNYQRVTFSGILNVAIDDDQYRLSSTTSASFADRVDIEGNTLAYPTATGQPIYLGLPEIRCSEPNAQIWIGGQRFCDTQSIASYGVQTVKLKSPEGLTLFHKRLAVLPSDFSLLLKPGESPKEGSILCSSMSNFVISYPKNENVESRRINKDGEKEIILKALGMPPANITLSVRANLETSPIMLQLPFPSQGVLAFDSEGNPLRHELVIDDLLGCRLQLFPRMKSRASYLVELLSSIHSQDAKYAWQFDVCDQPMEINLYEMRQYISELFAISPNNLDAQIRLRISGDCQTQTYRLQRYDCRAERDEMAINLSAIQALSDKKAKPVTINLTDPKEKPTPLVARRSEGIETGLFEYNGPTNSPRLIVPSKDSALNFRAIFLPGNKSESTNSIITSLYKAVEEFHPVDNPQVLYDVLTLMSNDFMHSGWQYLIDLFEQFSYLPLTTFEVWKALANHEKALCMLAFRLEKAPELMERLQTEFNVFWDLLTLTSWQAAYRQFNAYYRSLGFPDLVLVNLEKDKLAQIAEFSPIFHEQCNYLLANTENNPLPPKEQMSLIAQHSWYQELMRLHKDDANWPTMFSYELNEWYSNLSDKPLDISIHNGFHQSVVIFPFFAAAVVTGNNTSNTLINESPLNTFKLRQILEFDRHWFVPMFHYCLSYFAGKE